MRRWLSIAKGLVLGGVAVLAPRAFAGEARALVVVYDGWGGPTAFSLSGRVLEDQGVRAPSATASEADNVVDNLKALESDEVRDAEVRITAGASSYTATTDADGVFTLQVKGLPAAAALPVGEVPVSVVVLKPKHAATARGIGRLFIHDGPLVGVVSDVDDTVVKTHVTDASKLVGAVLLKNSRQLDAVVGAAAAYRKARERGARAFFYLSGSPQNFYLRIQDYLATQGFPAGPLLLKNFGDDALTKQEGYKLARLEALLASLPAMRVVLVGDSGERDPEIYAEARKRHPERVLGIVIRKTPGSDVTAARFAGMRVVDDVYPDDGVLAAFLP
ncbi:MAG: App1 family protein [Deltaproteobacteria bacterium]|nr:App1 family protein [Deltaproteobacteria bacterium]